MDSALVPTYTASTSGEPSQPAAGLALLRRFGFRFICAYFLLYALPTPFTALPLTGWLDSAFQASWHWLANRVGTHLLHLPPFTFPPTGSGDTLADYVILACTVVLALLIACVWTAVARTRSHPRLAEGLRLYLRYTLAVVMFGYGIQKLFALQFPSPQTYRLLERIGDASPMGLLWTFMGASTPYQMIAGGLETLGAVLLLFRRTATLGALLLVGVMGNVVLLNFCYDVPVKLFSSNLVLMSLVIAAPDARRLFDLLVLNRPVAALPQELPLEKAWMRRARWGVKAAFIGWVVGSGVYQFVATPRPWGPGAPQRTEVTGYYEVESFQRNGVEVPPLLTERQRWREVLVTPFGLMEVRPMDGRPQRFGARQKPGSSTLEISNARERIHQALTVARPDPDHLELSGQWDGAALRVRLKKVEPVFLLTTRGFHWVNEQPFNR